MVVIGKARGAPNLRQRIRIRARLADFRFRRPGLRQVGRHLLTGRLQDRVNDALVARTAAVGVLERCADVGFGHSFVRSCLAIEQALGCHDESGRADSTLHGAMIEKGLLQCV